MEFSAMKIKEIDNKLTYAIGYRNLYNIVVLAIGSTMLMISPIEISTVSTFAFLVFILGAKWFLAQLFENLDTISVNEMNEG